MWSGLPTESFLPPTCAALTHELIRAVGMTATYAHPHLRPHPDSNSDSDFLTYGSMSRSIE